MKKIVFGVFIILIGNNLWAHNEEIKPYSENRAVQKHIDELNQLYDFDRDYLLEVFQLIKRDDEVLQKISKPAEKSKPWYEYQKIFLDQSRIDNGVIFYKENKKWLDQVYKKFGVDPYIIVAIIGVETRYGKVTGTTPTLQSLSTLCFDYPPRAKFFCSELDFYLRLARQENWNPLMIKGSYAGALGMAQFMPSSYTNDAIDMDEDGHINLWESNADAIGSIGNYLKNRGWVKDQEIVLKINQIDGITDFGKTHKPYISVSDLLSNLHDNKEKTNISLWSEKNHLDKIGTLTLEDEQKNVYFLTAENFYVITRYNTSPMYAMAVVDLANEIKLKINDGNE